MSVSMAESYINAAGKNFQQYLVNYGHNDSTSDDLFAVKIHTARKKYRYIL